MRFVPYIGAFVAAFFPLTLAIAVDPGWSMLIWTVGLIIVADVLVGHVMEPMLFGHSSGLSPFAVVVSATFWTALWGPIGLVLAAPMTICLVVLGHHVESMKFFDILLGDRPALSPPEIFYQRMLANDPGEAVEKAEEYLKERTLTEYYEEVALKGLKLAQSDLKRDRLPLARLRTIRDNIVDLIEDLSDEIDDARIGTTDDVKLEQRSRRRCQCQNCRSSFARDFQRNGRQSIRFFALPSAQILTKPLRAYLCRFYRNTDLAHGWRKRKIYQVAEFSALMAMALR